MIEAAGQHADWHSNPDHAPVELEKEVLDLAAVFLPAAPKKPKLPPRLEGWTGQRIDAMNYYQLRSATEHYRDTGHTTETRDTASRASSLESERAMMSRIGGRMIY